MPFLIIRSLSLRPWLLTKNSCSYGANDPQQLLSASFYQFRSPLNKTLPLIPKDKSCIIIKIGKTCCCLCLWESRLQTAVFWEILPSNKLLKVFVVCRFSSFFGCRGSKASLKYSTRGLSTTADTFQDAFLQCFTSEKGKPLASAFLVCFLLAVCVFI